MNILFSCKWFNLDNWITWVSLIGGIIAIISPIFCVISFFIKKRKKHLSTKSFALEYTTNIYGLWEKYYVVDSSFEFTNHTTEKIHISKCQLFIEDKHKPLIKIEKSRNTISFIPIQQDFPSNSKTTMKGKFMFDRNFDDFPTIALLKITANATELSYSITLSWQMRKD